MMFFKLLLTPHSSRRQRTLTWDSSRREGPVFFCLCVRMGLWVIYGVFYTARGQRGVSERWAESGMERTPHSAVTAKAEEFFSLFKIPSYNPRLLLFSPFPISSHAQQFPQIWGLIPIFPPSASEWNLISPRSTPANLALMLQSDLRLLSLSYLSAEWNSSVILKSPTESNLIFLTISHTNVCLKRSNALFYR